MSKLGSLDAIRFSTLLKKFRKSPRSCQDVLSASSTFLHLSDSQSGSKGLQFGTSRYFSLCNFWVQYYRNSETSFRRTSSLFPQIDKQCKLLHSRAEHTFQQSIAHIYLLRVLDSRSGWPDAAQWMLDKFVVFIFSFRFHLIFQYHVLSEVFSI